MKLFIDNEEFNFSTTLPIKERSALHQKVFTAFTNFYTHYNIASRGFGLLKFKNDVYTTATFTNAAGKNPRTVKAKPNSKSMALREEVYIDGNMHNIICADVQRKLINGDFEYEGDRVRIKDDKVIPKEDKALLAFLFMFSSSVDGMMNGKVSNLKNRIKWFYFDNPVAEAKTKMKDRELSFEAYNIVKDMKIKNVPRFAATIGIPVEGMSEEEIKNSIITTVENNADMFDKLKDFEKTHNTLHYDVEAKVGSALKNGVISWVRVSNSKGNVEIHWGLGKPAKNKDFKKTDILHSYEAEHADENVLIEYFKENDEAYNDFLGKL